MRHNKFLLRPHWNLRSGRLIDRSLTRVRTTWDNLGTIDPMWAIDTRPSKFGLKWSETEFFEVGKAEVDGVVATVRTLPAAPGMQRALDFGCGMGRLSRALCDYYELVDGVDVARSMIELANGSNAHRERCTFTLNEAADLRIFADETFDFVYSNIVLQHMAPKLALNYVREFARCARRGAVIVFQIPHVRHFNVPTLRRILQHGIYALLPSRVVSAYRRRKYTEVPREVVDRLPKIAMEMHCISQKRIVAALRPACRLLAVRDTSRRNDAFVSNMYFFEKLA